MAQEQSKSEKTAIYIGLIIIAILIAWLLSYFHRLEGRNAELSKELLQSKSMMSDQETEIKRYKNGSANYLQQIEILSADNATLTGKLLKVEGISKPEVQVRWKTRIEIVNQPLQPDSSADTTASLLFRRWVTSNEFFTIKAHTDTTGRPTIDSLRIKCDWQVTQGFKRTGLLGLKKVPELSVVTSNPYVPVADLQSIKIEQHKPFLLRPVVMFGIGAIAGMLIITH